MKRMPDAMIGVVGVAQGKGAQSEELTTIAMEEAIVFTAPSGGVAKVSPGSYVVEMTETGEFSMVPAAGEAVTAQAIRAAKYWRTEQHWRHNQYACPSRQFSDLAAGCLIDEARRQRQPHIHYKERWRCIHENVLKL